MPTPPRSFGPDTSDELEADALEADAFEASAFETTPFDVIARSKFARDVEMRVISFLGLPSRFGNLWQGEEFCKFHCVRGKAVLTVRGFRARR